MRHFARLVILCYFVVCPGCGEMPPSASELFEQAEEARLKEQHDDAYRLFKLVVEADPENAIAWLRVGTYALMNGIRSVALDAFAQALELDPQLAVAYNNRAALHIIYREWELALSDASKAIELDPKDASAYIHRGNALHSLGRDEEALADLDTALRLDQSELQAFHLRGTIKIAMGDSAGAVADYDEAIQLDGSRAYLFINRAGARYKLRQFSGAIDDAREAIRLEPNDPVNHSWLAHYHLARGESEDAGLAVVHAGRACELTDRKEFLFLGQLAKALMAAGRNDDAQAALEDAKLLAPPDNKELIDLEAAIQAKDKTSGLIERLITAARRGWRADQANGKPDWNENSKTENP